VVEKKSFLWVRQYDYQIQTKRTHFLWVNGFLELDINGLNDDDEQDKLSKLLVGRLVRHAWAFTDDPGNFPGFADAATTAAAHLSGARVTSLRDPNVTGFPAQPAGDRRTQAMTFTSGCSRSTKRSGEPRAQG